jgi:hypothetical protein
VVLDEAMMRRERLNFHPARQQTHHGLASADLMKFLRASGASRWSWRSGRMSRLNNKPWASI